jgi:hypothetical protein
MIPDMLKFMEYAIRLSTSGAGVARVEGLHLQMREPSPVVSLLLLLKEPTRLRSLDLNSRKIGTRATQSLADPIQTLLSSRPPLQHLQIRGVSFDWDRIPRDAWPRNLITLSLSVTDTTPTEFFTLLELSSHTLRSVAYALDQKFSGTTLEQDGSKPVHQMTHLRSLKRVTIIGRILLFYHLYLRFSHPTTTNLQLHIHPKPRGSPSESHNVTDGDMITALMTSWRLWTPPHTTTRPR